MPKPRAAGGVTAEPPASSRPKPRAVPRAAHANRHPARVARPGAVLDRVGAELVQRDRRAQRLLGAERQIRPPDRDTPKVGQVGRHGSLDDRPDVGVAAVRAERQVLRAPAP